jgi:hypothetical protein
MRRLRALALLLASCAPAAPPATPPPASLHLARLDRLTASSGVRNFPTVAAGDSGYVVFWEESRDLTPGNRPDNNVRIYQARFDREWKPIGAAAPAVSQWGNQFGPATRTAAGSSYLAYYFADMSLRTGERDVILAPFKGLFDAPRPAIRVTLGNDKRHPPINHASPAILALPERNRIVIANSWGYYHAERPFVRAYDDKNIEARIFDLSGRLLRRVDLTTSRERGWELTPSLAAWTGPRGPGYLLAYLSAEKSQRSEVPEYNVFLKEFDLDWRMRRKRQLTFAQQGVTLPSLLVQDATPYLSWSDNATADVQVARLNRDLAPHPLLSLREELARTGFRELGRPYAALTNATLFDDRGRLGLAFVATMAIEAASNSAQMDVFVARLERPRPEPQRPVP